MGDLWSLVGSLVFLAGIWLWFFRSERRRKCRFLPVCEGISSGYFGNVDEILSRNKVTHKMLSFSSLAQLPGMGAATLFVVNEGSVFKTASQMGTSINIARAVYEILDKKGLIAEQQHLADLSAQQLG